eukprot:11132989-Prorocentrum_lima.AAC.1
MEGRFVGYHDRTGTVLAMTRDGVVRGRSVVRQPDEDAWSAKGFKELKGSPWSMVEKEPRLPKPVTE